MENILLDRNDAFDLLKKLGASSRLLRHLELVLEAADLLIKEYENLGLNFDKKLIELGVAIHDAGKILHPVEMNEPGIQHEVAGRDLLIKYGVQPKVAACCISHGQWNKKNITFEELSVALSDKLWKGKREPELELMIIDMVAQKLNTNRWTIFQELDSVFEKIALDGDDRLRRSKI
jgi:hypothetical protein